MFQEEFGREAAIFDKQREQSRLLVQKLVEAGVVKNADISSYYDTFSLSNFPACSIQINHPDYEEFIGVDKLVNSLKEKIEQSGIQGIDVEPIKTEYGSVLELLIVDKSNPISV